MITHASLFGIGIGEMVIIAAIALVVIGPERFPEFARIVMRTIRDIRGYVDEAKQELDKELRPIKKEMRQLEQYQPKRYFDDITNKPKPKPVDSPDLADEDSTPKDAPGTVPASEESPTEASPEPEASSEAEPKTTAYAPPSEADYDRKPTPFPPEGQSPYEEVDEEEPYRD